MRDLREKAGHATAADFARDNGFEQGTYRSHENGSRGIRFRAAMAYAGALHPDAADKVALWILDGGPPPDQVLLGPGTVPASFEDEYALVPDYDIRASAGDGAIFDSENILDSLAFRRQWLRLVTNAPLDQMAVIQAHGDSMEPTIRSGDHLLVDRTDTNPRRAGHLRHRLVRGRSTSSASPSITRPGASQSQATIRSIHTNQGVSPDDLAVLGRVIWIGRRL